LSEKPLAPHFDQRSCGEKTTAGQKTVATVKVGIAQILPFMVLITPAPGRTERKREYTRPISNHSSATI
jgi:hypothetical protein